MICRLVFVAYLLIVGLAICAGVYDRFGSASAHGESYGEFFSIAILVAAMPWSLFVVMVLEAFDILTDELFLIVSVCCVATNVFLLWGTCFSSMGLVFRRAGWLILGVLLSLLCLFFMKRPAG